MYKQDMTYLTWNSALMGFTKEPLPQAMQHTNNVCSLNEFKPVYKTASEGLILIRLQFVMHDPMSAKSALGRSQVHE